ncbi:MAG: hypothetical protein JWM89_3306 [Acidimicrobiales bacterium]|nr:hypothetical protein [Acidimicrobiales bacterium]
MSDAGRLAPDYLTARARFLAAAGSAGATLDHHPFPDLGPTGEELAIDVAWLGPADPDRVILVVSGTHGVEGYAGSMCQSRWLESNPAPLLPEGLALVFLHAFNPYGFAWVRRVNEDNVDVNRNFADLHAPPRNEGYDELAAVLAPSDWSSETQAATGTALVDWAEINGWDAIQAAVSGGQYGHPDGVFYGGTEPVRSHRIMRAFVEDRLTGADRVVMLDLHTGLGAWGEVELITNEAPGSEPFERAKAWWGDRVASNGGGDSVSAELNGEWMAAVTKWLEPAEVSAVALEWGTVDSITVLQALRADNWLHNHGDPTGADATPIKADLRAAFAPDDPAWADTVYDCFDGVLARSLELLG